MGIPEAILGTLLGLSRRYHGRCPPPPSPRSLQSDAGRKKLLRCIQERLPISGRPSASGTDTAGIDECKSVVDAMEKMKAGANPEDRKQESEAKPEALEGAEEGEEGEGKKNADDAAPVEDVELIDEQEVPLEDPVLKKAKDTCLGRTAKPAGLNADSPPRLAPPPRLPGSLATGSLLGPTGVGRLLLYPFPSAGFGRDGADARVHPPDGG